MVWGLLFDVLLGHSEALAVTGLGIYIAYETRFGVMRDVREDLHIVGVGLYRVIERDEELDEQKFREELWGDDNGGSKLLASDLDKETVTEKGD